MKTICAFCGKEAGEVKTLFNGPPIHICDECVSGFNSRLKKEPDACKGEDPKKLREEIDHAVSEAFRHIVANLDLGELHEKYQLLMTVKFQEGPNSPKFDDVFDEFKRGVSQVISEDDFQTRYDLGIAYHEMGLKNDSFRELFQSLRFALKAKNWQKAEQVMSVIMFVGFEPKKVVDSLSGLFKEMA
jgi:hypothetical protein